MKKQLLFWAMVLMGLTSDAQDANIKVGWELRTNFPESTYKSIAEFTIENKGEKLNDNNWALFFSLAPSLVTSLDKNKQIDIEHINGDWYRIFPKKGFYLAPGKKVTFQYGSNRHVVKEVLAPMGLYIVFYDKNGKQNRIANIKDFTIHPFSRKEQMLRGKTDKYTAFSHEQVFAENKDLSEVSEDDIPPFVPFPHSYSSKPGYFLLKDMTPISFSSQLLFEAEYLREKTKELTGKILFVDKKNAKGKGIHLAIDKAIMNSQSESYTLSINSNGIEIKGTDVAGVFYGVQSLLSLFASAENVGKEAQIKLVYIEDKPRFSFRSLHLDVARNFQSKETILRTLDMMAHYKLNNFLFYTSEDEGWRVEISGLPELTQIGSNRLHPKNGKETKGVIPAYGSGPFTDKDTHGSGYYSRKDYIEILKYAKARHINVVPELNFPGHARAAIVAMENRYHRFMKDGNKKAAEEYRLIDPLDSSVYLSPQLFKDNVVNISRESAYRFYEKVIDEFAAMYKEAGLKLTKIHAGGDEVAKGAWSGSPEVQKWAKDRGVKNNFLSLQAAFFKELVRRMEKKGLEVHGWEEVVILHTDDNKYVPNTEFVTKKVVPYIWNNEFSYPDMGYQLANAGYDIVLCNVTNLYFDLAYSNDPKEPGLVWAGFVDTKDAWGFAPYQFQHSTLANRLAQPVYLDKPSSNFQQLKHEAKKRVRGVQAQLWSETIKGREMLEYYLLPKLIGFAETAWGKERSWESMTDREQRIRQMNIEWNQFANVIAKYEFPTLQKWNGGYNFRIPPVGVKKENGMVRANVAFPGLEIRYTADGSVPTKNSNLYTHPFIDKTNLNFKAFVKE